MSSYSANPCNKLEWSRVLILNYLQAELAEISWELLSNGFRSYEKRSIEVYIVVFLGVWLGIFFIFYV